MEKIVFLAQLTWNSIQKLEFAKELPLHALKTIFSMINQKNAGVLKMLVMMMAIDAYLVNFLTSGIKMIKIVSVVEKTNFLILNPRHAFNVLMIILISIPKLLSVLKSKDHALNLTFIIPSLINVLAQAFLLSMMEKHAKNVTFPISGT
jgi:hypothetical protein